MPKSQKVHIDSPKPNTPRTPDIEYNNALKSAPVPDSSISTSSKTVLLNFTFTFIIKKE